LRDNFLAEDVEESLAVKSIGESYARIETGVNLRFRLQANPTKRVGKSDVKAADKFKPSPDAKIRRRVELIGDENETVEEKQIKWLARKGEGAGFQIANVAIKAAVQNAVAVGQGKLQARRGDGSRPMTFGTVIFDGVLRVTDADKFRETLIKGIGSGKAYGFGLLSVAPVNSGD
jgi:CRISPR system Cascade subunit CasE